MQNSQGLCTLVQVVNVEVVITKFNANRPFNIKTRARQIF